MNGPVDLPARGSIFGDQEAAAVAAVIDSPGPLSAGVWRERFEDAMRAHLGVPYVVSLTSGTTALRVALHLLDLNPGDEVIVPAQTYQATIQPLLEYGARVRFCDVEESSLNLNPALIPGLITARTRAIVVVHYGGRPADMDSIMRIADRHGLTVIEDAAHALGGAHRGRPVGSSAHMACFSFHSSKNISTLGEGGLLALTDRSATERARILRDNRVDAVTVPARHRFGGVDRAVVGALFPHDSYTTDCTRVRAAGINGTLSEAACAVGLVQLRKLPVLAARRRAIAARYAAALAQEPGVRLMPVDSGTQHAYHFFTFFADPSLVDRDAVLHHAHRSGLRLQLRYFPLHLMPEWRSHGHGEGECPVTERLWFREQINLPCQPALTDAQVDRVIAIVREALSEAARPPARTSRASIAPAASAYAAAPVGSRP